MKVQSLFTACALIFGVLLSTNASAQKAFIYIYRGSPEQYGLDKMSSEAPVLANWLATNRVPLNAFFVLSAQEFKGFPPGLLRNFHFLDANGSELQPAQSTDAVVAFGMVSALPPPSLGGGNAVNALNGGTTAREPSEEGPLDRVAEAIRRLGGASFFGLLVGFLTLLTLWVSMIRSGVLLKHRHGKIVSRIRGEADHQDVFVDNTRIHKIYEEIADPHAAQNTLRAKLLLLAKNLEPEAFSTLLGDKLKEESRTIGKEIKTAQEGLEAKLTQISAEVSTSLTSNHESSNRQLTAVNGKIDSFVNKSDSIQAKIQSSNDALREELQWRIWLPGEAEIPDLRTAIGAVGSRVHNQKTELSSAGVLAGEQYLTQCVREVEVMSKCARLTQIEDQSGVDDLLNFADPYRRVHLQDVEALAVPICGEAERMLQHLRRRLESQLLRAGCHIERPIPGITKFDSTIHRMLPNLNRSTPRPELAEVVCERLRSGVYMVGEGSQRRVLQFAEVGRYVFESSPSSDAETALPAGNRQMENLELTPGKQASEEPPAAEQVQMGYGNSEQEKMEIVRRKTKVD